MSGQILSMLAFALVTTIAIMTASWALQRSSRFRQVKVQIRLVAMAATIFAVTFAMQLIWPS